MKDNDIPFIDECQYWIQDDISGTILNDSGDKKFFTENIDAFKYIQYGKTSKIETILRKIKEVGFKELTDEEQKFLKSYNKKCK